VISFLRLVNQLKTQKRTGWVYRHVNNPESVADHQYRMAVMSFLLHDDRIDKGKVMKIALVHDMSGNGTAPQ
jgi:putative hydrolase of HD superfamily